MGSSNARKWRSLIIVTAGSICGYCGISFYKNDEGFHRKFIMPLVHLLDPEIAHKSAVLLTKYRLFPKSRFEDPESLHVEIFGLNLKNPIGLAAGFDKNAEAVKGLSEIGFGFIEVGSVTPLPQEGNEKPRLFRLKADKAVINRYGFNNEGHQTIYKRLETVRNELDFDRIVGVNLGKNKLSNDSIGDYIKGIRTFAEVADYLVINISSPNTPGLRNMQQRQELTQLLRALIAFRNGLKIDPQPPLLLKIAPDLNSQDLKNIVEVLMEPHCHVDGLIISNTTVERPETLQEALKKETGGLSGEPLKQKSTELIKEVYTLTKGKIPIIGVGGISNGEDAYEKIRHGATVVQLYTSLVYEGFPIVTKIKRELATLLERDGFKNISEAVGADVKL